MLDNSSPKDALFVDERINEICEQFEAKCQNSAAQIEDYITRIGPSNQPALFVELLLIDVELQLRAGNSLSAESYLLRFPRFGDLVRQVLSSETLNAINSMLRSSGDEAFSTADFTPNEPNCPQFSAGMQFGPYTLERFLGAGEFGEVWLANRVGEIAETKLAIKLPFKSNQTDDRLRREAELWATASGHPNIVPIFEAARYENQILIASEYIRSGTLQDRLSDGASLKMLDAMNMMCGILGGLCHLHGLGMIHRDIKPTNVLMKEGLPCLADFGFADLLTESSSSLVAGSPAYMAPEAFYGERSHQTDIWSAGVMFYQLLSGRLPFTLKGSYRSIVRSIRSSRPVELPQDLPAGARVIMRKSLNKQPSLRYGTAREMLRELIECRHNIRAMRNNYFFGWGRLTDIDNDCALNVKDDRLSIFIPGSDHDLGAERGVLSAPRVTRKVTGDFEVQVRVNGRQNPANPDCVERLAFHGAGIVIWQDEGTYLRLERACAMTQEEVPLHYVNFEYRFNGEFVRWGGQIDMRPDVIFIPPDAEPLLRIQRSGVLFAAHACIEPEQWVFVGVVPSTMIDKLEVGLLAVNTSKEPLAVEFTDYSLKCPDDNTEHRTGGFFG